MKFIVILLFVIGNCVGKSRRFQSSRRKLFMKKFPKNNFPALATRDIDSRPSNFERLCSFQVCSKCEIVIQRNFVTMPVYNVCTMLINLDNCCSNIMNKGF